MLKGGFVSAVTRCCGVLLLLLPALSATALAAQTEAPIALFYQGRESLVLGRLQLDPSTRMVDSLNEAQAAVLQDQLPGQGPALDALKSRVEAGMGLTLILGADTDPSALKALTDGAVEQTGIVDAPAGADHAMAAEKFAAIINYVGPDTDPIGSNVSWKSAVRVQERSLLKIAPSVSVMVATTASDPIHRETPILLRMKLGRGRIFILNVWIKEGNLAAREKSYIATLKGARDTQNYDFQRFFFFNWILYAMTRESAGVTPVRFGQWIAAPVPGRIAISVLVAIFTTTVLAVVLGALWARRYSLRHPEALHAFYRSQTAHPKPESLGAAAVPQESAQPAAAAAHGDPRWEVVGFHRPLSGFIYNYLLNIFVIIPFNLLVTFWIDRNFINPFLEARGAAGLVGQVLLFLIPLLDLGTSQAMVKYFAEYRVKEPSRAITYMQFFVWFHLLLGVLALTAFGLLGAINLGDTTFAYLSWFVVLNILGAFPPFGLSFLQLFRAQQRFDYVQLSIVLIFVFNPAVQMAGSVLGRHWGLTHPVFGEGLGVMIGFGCGTIAANIMIGLILCAFYERMGMRLLTILLAHFDRDTIKQSIVFGAKLTAGSVMPFLSWGLVPIIMGALLPNFLELNEIWLLTYSLTYAYLETGVYIFSAMMPSMSESYSQNMVALTRRYIDQGMRWGLIATSMMGVAYVVFCGPMIAGLLPPQFRRAIGVLVLIHIMRLFDFFTRAPDQVFQATGRSGTFTWAAIIEHVGRVVFLWLFIRWWGFHGVFWAFTASAALKIVFAWPVMAKAIIEPVFSVWQTFVNPIITAVASYFILSAMAAAIWRGPGAWASTWLTVLVTLLGSLPIYMFICGFLGWDDAELRELKDAVDLVPAPFSVVAHMTYKFVNLGVALSPLHNRFRSRLDEEASREAAILTSAKVDISA